MGNKLISNMIPLIKTVRFYKKSENNMSLVETLLKILPLKLYSNSTMFCNTLWDARHTLHILVIQSCNKEHHKRKPSGALYS